VLIYRHVERKSMVIHSQVINCTASDVAAMVEGAMHHGGQANLLLVFPSFAVSEESGWRGWLQGG
jgi:TnpA family transposase